MSRQPNAVGALPLAASRAGTGHTGERGAELPGRPKRVLVIAPTPFFGDRGCHVRIYEEIRGLNALGIESYVVTYPTGRDLPDVEIERAYGLPGVQARALGPSFARPLLDVGVFLAAQRVIRRVQPALIHGHLHEGIVIGAALRVWHQLPLVADLQGSLTAELVDHGTFTAHGMAAALSRRIERRLVRWPDRIVTSSTNGISLLEAQGVVSSHVAALPDGVDVQAFRPREPDPALVSRLGLQGKRVVVFLGVLTPYQGVDSLLDVVPLVVRSVPDAHFLVLGYPNEEKYRARVQELGLTDVVSLPGRVNYEDAGRWLSLGHVAVSLKRSPTEANGKLLNYMACGLPVVASDTVVNRELLGDDGRYAAIDDTEGAANLICELLSARDRGRAVGEALRRRAEQLFSWPVLAGRLAKIYGELAPVPDGVNRRE